MACDGQQAKDRGDRGEEHGPQALGAGAHDQIEGVEVWPFLAQAIERIDEHDVVIHHDPGEGHNPHPRQDGTEGLTRDDQAEQHAGGGHHHGEEDEPGLIEAVELGYQ